MFSCSYTCRHRLFLFLASFALALICRTRVCLAVEPRVRVTCALDQGPEALYLVHPRSWQGISFSFGTVYSTSSFYFDGANVGIEMYASCPVDGTFTVELYRNNYEFVGSAEFKRNGFTKAVWENVGAGTYKFKFRKTADGTSVSSSDASMYSW